MREARAARREVRSDYTLRSFGGHEIPRAGIIRK